VCQVEELHDGELAISEVDVTSNLASDWPGATAAEVRRDVHSQLTAVIAVLKRIGAAQ
jgi:hypothetical protein